MEKDATIKPIFPYDIRRKNFDWISDLGSGRLLISNNSNGYCCERVVALAPPGQFNEFTFGKQVHRLARAMLVPVLVVGLPGTAENWYREQVKLNLISSVIQSRETPARAYSPEWSDWTHIIHEIARPGDFFVTVSAHYQKNFLGQRQTMAEWLQKKLHLTVFELDGLSIEKFPHI